MLCGYADPISAAPGRTVDLMVSTDAREFSLEVVRLLHGDPNPAGPGYQDEATDWVAPGPYPGRLQEIHPGSFLTLPPPGEPLASVTFACWVCPTAPTPRDQPILTWGEEPGLAFALRIDADYRLTGTVTDSGRVDRWLQHGAPLLPARWCFVGFTFDAARRELGLLAGPRGCDDTIVERARVGAAGIFPAAGPMLMGARLRQGVVQATFNGKIAHPRLLAAALDDLDIFAVAKDVHPPGVEVLGDWDLSRQIDTDRVVDRSGKARHGLVHNAPSRGVPGPRWRGAELDVYSGAPSQYDAVHLHDDDIDDAGWEPSLRVSVPAGARSGIYAARLRAGAEELTLPLIVRDTSQRRAPALFIVPTLTWLAYSNWGEPERHRYGLSLYSVHNDGSSNYYASLRRPSASYDPCAYFDPGEGRAEPDPEPGTEPEPQFSHGLMADLYTIHWLEHLGVEYAVISDHDFHDLGEAALAGHQAVISAGHHEYWTERMLDALDGYLRGGGRFMYLGGNGLYWVTSIDSRRPHLMEVRRFGGHSTSKAEPGERQHSTTLETGGTWRVRGRPPQQLVGVGFGGVGFTRAAGYRRLPGSFDPRVAFIFEGVGADDPIGDFGLNLGGAAGYEIDRFAPELGSPPHALLLASSFDHGPNYFRAADEGIGRAPDDTQVRADMVYFETPNGGAVFSTGSITWTGSLSHRSYDNALARVTTNVLRRFMDPRPLGEAGTGE